MVERIDLGFPALRGAGDQGTSLQDRRYNGIAWAAGDTTEWWWPTELGSRRRGYWPPGAPRLETLEAFRDAFATLGYVVCNDDRLEPGYEKVALFALLGVPKH